MAAPCRARCRSARAVPRTLPLVLLLPLPASGSAWLKLTPWPCSCRTASNVAVVLLNKHLLSNTGFRQLVFLTLCHMAACCALSYALSAAGAFPLRRLRSRAQAANVSLLAAIFCITVVLGNVSLKYVPVSFSQAVGAATPAFTALFALGLQGAPESRGTYLTLLPIVAGVAISSGGEPGFHAAGFAACLLATAGRALKGVVQAMLLSDPSERLDPMSLLFYMSSVSVLLLAPAAWLLEPGAPAQAAALAAGAPGFAGWLALNCFMAWLVNLTNFLVTKYTSALTLQVVGNMKGVVAAGVSIAIFRNPVTPVGCAGSAVTMGGVFAYSAAKRRAAAARAAEASSKVCGGGGGGEVEPLLVKAALAMEKGLAGGGGGACEKKGASGGGGGGPVVTLIAAACGGGGGTAGLLPAGAAAAQLHRPGRSSCGGAAAPGAGRQ
ncbi:MAG: triose-phosphate transporter family-domain-containing protein [Monoraphidium minutum]|nr:MAG: triose-phosphate transporter family-domain-containing protein [Monoraphidium minutum]